VTFSISEIQIIKSAILLRQQTNGIDPKWDKMFERILAELKYDVVQLTASERPLIRGCIKDLIRPNQILNSRSELDLLLADNDVIYDYVDFDLANALLNKLGSRGDDVEHIFKPTFQKIDKIKNAKKVLFSISNNGNMYKLAFVTDNKGGYRINIRDGKLDEFKMADLDSQSFTNSGNASDLLSYLEWYEMKNSTTEYLTILKKIAQKACG